jgi:hypothetical protein
VFVEKNLFFIFLGANKRKKQFRSCLRNEREFPLFPPTKEHIYNLCWSFSLLWVCSSFLCEGKANFYLCFFSGWYGLGWWRVRVETPQEDICFFLGMEWEFGGEGG